MRSGCVFAVVAAVVVACGDGPTGPEMGTVEVEVTASGESIDIGCTVDGDNPVSVTVTAEETSTVSFALTCAPIPPPT